MPCRSLRRGMLAALAALSSASFALCSCAPEPRRYEATIRRTAYGVPHVVADDPGSLAFGQGFAFAEDHACVLADQILKIRGERARFFGRGDDDAHVDGDFAYRHLGLLQAAAGALAVQPEEARTLVRGFAAGVNALLAERTVDGLPEPCRGRPWVRPISEVELFAYYLDLALLGSARQIVPLVARAAPPSPGALSRAPPPLPDFRRPGMGSNGWAVGSERSAHGGGLLLGNPHFPWRGELMLSEVHLTIPGELDVYGATLMGVVGVLVGFNEDVAWTHTVSFAPRMTFRALTLHSGDPTAYIYDGKAEPMTSHEHAVLVLQEDGTLSEERRTLWRSRFGPMLDMPLYGWGSDVAFTVQDANFDNHGLIEQFRRMNRARSLDELLAAHDEVQGIPWVNTIAADREGRALYVDGSTVPNLAPDVLDDWLEARESDFFTRTLYERGAVLLPGDSSRTAWVDDPRAARPGIVPFEEAPLLVRRDFVVNANDSHWLANPAAPLTGFSPLYGEERTPRSARTRMNLKLLQEHDEPLAAGDLIDMLFDNRGLHADLLLDEVLPRCAAAGEVDVDGERVDVGAACAVLAAWDRRSDERSRGAALWREVLGAFGHAATRDAGPLYAVPFSPADPVGTPRGLAPRPEQGDDPLHVALGRAVLRLRQAGLPPDAPLGEAQRAARAGRSFPVHGGAEIDGVANIVGSTSLPSALREEPAPAVIVPETGLSEEGYAIDYGGSFVFTVALHDDGPKASALLVYGQSSDAASPHATDQLELYAAKALRPVLFTEDDIGADPALTVRVVRGADEGP